MSENVEQEEVEAILEATADESARQGSRTSGSDVRVRDFGEPRRFSDEGRVHVERTVRIELRSLEQDLKAILREAYQFELTELREVSAHGLFEDLKAPVAMAMFEVAGQIGWIQWEVVPAIRTIEVVLGAADAPEVETRPLSPVEGNVLLRILSSFAKRIGHALGAEVENIVSIDLIECVKSWTDAEESPDPQRVFLNIGIDGPSGPSALQLYLPGAQLPEHALAAVPPALPAHLENVDFVLSASLGSVDIPLSELLAIEVGDVIPLGTPITEPLTLLAEGRPCALGRLGSKAGALAVVIEQFIEADDES